MDKPVDMAVDMPVDMPVDMLIPGGLSRTYGAEDVKDLLIGEGGLDVLPT